MQDAIGRELNIGDYVTAVWANGDVALFKIAGSRFGNRKWQPRSLELKLERMFSEDWNNSNNKPTYKKESQVTWVDPDYVLMHFLVK